ncbi:MAG: hypothetical protein AAGF67_07495, partial [Verrucomicrobiota bacterium]
TQQPAALVSDPEAPVDLRARTWLSANCAHCHRNRGGGSVTMKLNLEVALDEMDAFDLDPEKGGFGATQPKLIAPGDPYRSMLYYRSVTAGIGHMPMIGAKTVDPTGAKILHDWILSLGENEEIEPGLGNTESALRLTHLIRTGEISGDAADGWIEKGKASENPIISGLFSEF